jgi:hypothetical protein
MKIKKKYTNDAGISLVVLILSLLALTQHASAATYFSMVPGDERCTVIYFGNNGRGEYTMTVTDPGEAGDNPWVDNHFTSLTARLENIITVPLCFSTIGRRVGESALITASVEGPNGIQRYEYGICVASAEQVNEIAAGGNSPCEDIGKHTDIFTASLDEPEMYAKAGDEVTFTLSIDSTVTATVSVARSSGSLDISASSGSVAVGGGVKEVTLYVTAPEKAGDYPFSVMVSAAGCKIDDCRRQVSGKLHVTETGKDPQASFYLFLTPGTKSVNGVTAADFTLKVKNYGAGQKITISAAVDDGLQTDFEPYTAFIESGGEKKAQLTVLPKNDDQKSYKITASATGEDGLKRSQEAWLTVNEMLSDAAQLGNDGFAQLSDSKDGKVTLDDWVATDSVTGALSGSGDEDDFNELDTGISGGINPFHIALIAVAVAGAAGIAFFYMRRHGRTGDEYAALQKSLR